MMATSWTSPGLRAIKAELDGRDLSIAQFAKRLGLRRQSVYNWDDVPIERLEDIVHVTGLSPRVLVPDLAARLRATRPMRDKDLDDLLLVFASEASKSRRTPHVVDRTDREVV